MSRRSIFYCVTASRLAGILRTAFFSRRERLHLDQTLHLTRQLGLLDAQRSTLC